MNRKFYIKTTVAILIILCLEILWQSVGFGIIVDHEYVIIYTKHPWHYLAYGYRNSSFIHGFFHGDW